MVVAKMECWLCGMTDFILSVLVSENCIASPRPIQSNSGIGAVLHEIVLYF